MDPTPTSEDTITFKRTDFYSVVVILAFAMGVLTGYIVWGRPSRAEQSVELNQPDAQTADQSTGFKRYEVASVGFPSLGPQDAPIVIVEFGDFQCPFCKRFFDETYQNLLNAYPGKIRFVFRHLPLESIHPEAFPAAEASMCANEQSTFWQYHDKIFENQDRLGRDLYMQVANDLNLNMTEFETCLNTRKYEDLIQQDLDFALNLGVRSTPTFFINGLAIVGAQPLETFKQIIDKELAGEIPK